MSFFNSSSVYPIANFAAIFAIGNPVAFEARAEERAKRRIKQDRRRGRRHRVLQKQTLASMENRQKSEQEII